MQGYSKRPGKKKRDASARLKKEEVNLVNLEESMNGVSEEEEVDEPTNYVPLPKSQYPKKEKKSKGNFLDKFKFMKKKGKKRKSDGGEEIEEVETPKVKKSREGSGPKKGRSSGGNKFFVNPFRAKEGKSVTFKK